MAIDTKPNFNSCKFEQCQTDTMNLSGCTQIHGYLDIENAATLTICANAGSGKILTSDALGIATWQPISALQAANNGLTKVGSTVVLGGALTGDTTINLCGHNLFFDDNFWHSQGETEISHDSGNNSSSLSITANATCLLHLTGSTHGGIYLTDDSSKICSFNAITHRATSLSLTPSGMTIQGLPAKTTATSVIYVNGTGGLSTGLTSTSTASGERITKLINQSHSFAVGDVVGWSGGTYNKPKADGLYDGEILGIVSKCYNANCFDLTQAGYVTGLTSLSANATHFLSDTTAGLLTTTEPTGDTHISKAVIVADSATSGWVLPYAGYIITSGDSGGGGTWGTISGTLSLQTDLQIALNSKANYFSCTISGNSSATGFTVNHALSKQFVIVQVVEAASPYATIYTDVCRTNANCVYVGFDTAPSNGTNYCILITG